MKEFLSTIKLLEHSSFFYIICTGLDGNYSYVNSNYARSFNYVDADLLGKPYYITMHPDDRRVCEETSYKCIQQPEKMFPATIRKHDGQGGYIITQWEFKAGFDEAGNLEGVFCIGYDITELDKSKYQLKQIAYQQSHVVRRPLANIMGLANILNKMEIDDTIKSLVEMMIQNADELDAVVKTIVDKTHE